MNKLIGTYKEALNHAFRHWKMTLLLYLIHLMSIWIVYLPVRMFFASGLSHTNSASALAESFDLNILMDLIHTNSLLLPGFVGHLMMITALYLVWLSFSLGAILGSYKKNSFDMSVFFGSGAKYFFKNLRLSFYVLIFYSLLIALAYVFFSKDGLHVFDLNDEAFLVQRFYYLSALLVLGFFMAGVWAVLVRVNILQDRSKLIVKDMLTALKQAISFGSILLGLLNFAVIASVVLLYMFLIRSSAIEQHPIVLTGLAQILILARIILKTARLGSFYKLIS